MSVGYVYDEIYQLHDTGAHVEGKDRLTHIDAVLEKTRVKEQLKLITPRAASIEEIAAIHSRDYIDELKGEIDRGGGWLDPDTYVSTGSWKAALYAAGGLLNAVNAVMCKEHSSAFALIRPPGHHAVHTHQMGFCLFNNVAIAAQFALKNYNIKKILIIDFDVHHGNGTQEAFYTDPHVLYFSIHQYPWYPFTGRADETGEGSGTGFNVNVPMEAETGDKEYLCIFNEVLVPIAQRYQPELILVSAGYDAHWKDDIARINLSTTGYARLTKIIKHIAEESCDGRMVYALEGGYHRGALAFSVAATFEVLLDHNSIFDPYGESPSSITPPDFDGFINMLRNIHNLNN